MRSAYTLLGLAFLLLIIITMVLFSNRAHAPVEDDTTTSSQEEASLPLLQQETTMQKNSSFSLTSESFENGAVIPKQFSCDGENVNPPLMIQHTPEDTVSLVLLVDDPDIPQEVKDARGIEVFDHWTLYNIPATTTLLEADGIPKGALQGVNGRGEQTYTGPCPPPEYEPTEHRYFFKLFALDTTLEFISPPTKDEVMEAMERHILAETQLMGIYDRSETSDTAESTE